MKTPTTVEVQLVADLKCPKCGEILTLVDPTTLACREAFCDFNPFLQVPILKLKIKTKAK